MEEKSVLADYAFRFDAFPERITFVSQIRITGWLLHRRGLPIRGIRGIVRSVLGRRSIFRARRKRSRPLIAAAYPDLPEAGQSGFLLMLELPPGRNKLTMQVQNDQKIWRTILVTDIWAFPLTLIGRIGLPRVERFLSMYLGQLVAGDGKRTVTSVRPYPLNQTDVSVPGGKVQRFKAHSNLTGCDIKAVRLFVTSKSNLFIREIAELLHAGFRGAKYQTQLLIDQIPAERTEDNEIQIVVTPHEFFNLFLRDKLPWDKVKRLTNQLFLLGTEQPESEWFDSNLIFAPHARAMLDINLAGVAAYRECGLNCFHLPLGYDRLLEQTSQPRKSERHIDICLLAAKTDRREEFIAANADFFAARNCHLRLVPIEFAKTEDTRSYLPAPQRNLLLQQSKILLNVHYSQLQYFEWHRALVALANRCCLITETCQGFEPLVPGKHFVMAKADDLTSCCEYYLNHEDEREAIAYAAYNFVRDHLTQVGNCRGFLEQITRETQDSKAGKEPMLTLASGTAASPAEPMPESLAAALSQKSVTRFFSALREDLSNFFRSSGAEPQRNGGTSFDSNETAQRIATVPEMRRGYIERFETQKKFQKQGKAIFQSIDNSPFDGSNPTISVIVTLYNYGSYIGQCLKSLEDSHTVAIPGGIEVVIVNDASTDDSLKQAMAVQKESRHPVRVIDKRVNTGLADARNLGLQLARAPYVFILDADNIVFPRALEQLHTTIVRDNSAAAYSILSRFHGANTSREGLLSYYDWDPQMLVEHPYIDAMALFDREQLIRIGGYDTSLFEYGWFGWEDYDLWLRIAQAELRVSFLPNVLCLYRHHGKAMSNTTNLFEHELVAHLFAKYHALVDKYPPKRCILGVDRSRIEKELRLTSLTRNQPARERDSGCSKDLAVERQTSAGAG